MRGIGCFYLEVIGAIGLPALVAYFVAGPLAGVLVGLGIFVVLFVIWYYLAFTNWNGIRPHRFTLHNNLTEEAVVTRVLPSPGAPHVLRPEERITFTKHDPMYHGVRFLPVRGRPLLLRVEDSAGRPLGRLLLNEAFVRRSMGSVICLSAAAEPPYVVDGPWGAAKTCPKLEPD